jgi:hypothetical protein
MNGFVASGFHSNGTKTEGSTPLMPFGTEYYRTVN